jgi:hypothetical protein
MSRVTVKPELLQSACERSRMDPFDLSARFPKLDAWLTAEALPTFKQLEDFAKATHTPFGYLLVYRASRYLRLLSSAATD